MAKPIKLGLELEGEDQERLDNYLDNLPELPPKGKALMERVKKKALYKGYSLLYTILNTLINLHICIISGILCRSILMTLSLKT